jgi:hypothetical protein
VKCENRKAEILVDSGFGLAGLCLTFRQLLRLCGPYLHSAAVEGHIEAVLLAIHECEVFRAQRLVFIANQVFSLTASIIKVIRFDGLLPVEVAVIDSDDEFGHTTSWESLSLELKKQTLQIDRSLHLAQTTSRFSEFPSQTKISDMARVMGISSAQAIRRRVWDSFKDRIGV